MEEKIERILRSAGIESSPLDPSSLEALRQLVINSEINSTCTGNNNSETGNGGAAVHVRVESPMANAWEMASARGSGMEEEITSPSISAQVPATLPAPQRLETLPEGSSTSNSASMSASLNVQTHSHNQIVEMLQMHTIIMMETQRKLDAMAAKVDALERHIRENSSYSYSASDQTAPSSTSARSDTFSGSTRTRSLRQSLHTAPYESNDNNDNTANTNTPNGLGQHATLNQHENEDAHADIARPNNEIGVFQSVVETISKFYVVRICRLFWTRSTGFVRPIDGALMFKLVFMLLVMTARMTRSNSSMTSKSATKLTISILMILGGFLYHTKYLQFFYQFFWKDNIPMRVWAGEDVEADIDGTAPRNGVDVQVPRFRNPDLVQLPGRLNQVPLVDAHAPRGDRFDNLRQNFIGGAIHPPNHEQNPILALVQDTLYLLGSFFLSIFPMWQPLQPPPQQQDHPAAEDEIEDNNNNHNPERDGQQRGHGPFHAIPVVAPPPDVMTPAEDDDDDDGDDDSTAASLE